MRELCVLPAEADADERVWEQTSTWPDDARGRTLAIPAAVFEHRAVLYTREHRPFSEVDEVYRRDVLAFPPPVR